LIGKRIMLSAPALENAARIVRSSHERLDGLGYPDGLNGEQIPLGARIILACDALDAMLSLRPLSRPRTIRDAISELQACARSQFDPAIVNALVAEITEAGLTANADGTGLTEAVAAC
jgi:HD-GYP domain-containing protein (c-di-GMP phosphodiesterase class II)